MPITIPVTDAEYIRLEPVLQGSNLGSFPAFGLVGWPDLLISSPKTDFTPFQVNKWAPPGRKVEEADSWAELLFGRLCRHRAPAWMLS